MTERSWQHVWMEQCEAAEGIRIRFSWTPPRRPLPRAHVTVEVSAE